MSDVKAPPTRGLSALATGSLADLLHSLNIASWDVLLVGDGSGSVWGRPCGWGCVSIERLTPQGEELRRRIWYGAVNNGTVNVAEGIAYLLPLLWIHSLTLDQTHGRPRFTRVHVLTDSQFVEMMGNKADTVRNKNGILWSAYNALKRVGVNITWHWVGRNEVALNQYADLLSKLSRKLFGEHALGKRILTQHGLDVRNCNP